MRIMVLFFSVGAIESPEILYGRMKHNEYKNIPESKQKPITFKNRFIKNY